MKFQKFPLSLLLVASFLFFWNACDNILEPDPKSFTSTANFYQTPEDFSSALNGAYNRLRTQAGISQHHFNYWNEIRTDVINRHFDVNLPSIQGQPIAEWFVVSSNAWVQSQWAQIYNTITQTNIILGRIDDIEFPDSDLKNEIIGEAKFIRALSYWYAVQYWGDVPIVLNEITSPDEAMPEDGRRPVNEVYAQIISDLEMAADLLPVAANEPGRATEGAAKLLLGRTFLLTGDYGDAVSVLEEVETNYGYVLLDDYIDIWDPNNTNNEESIFELQFGANVTGQPHADIIRQVLPWNSRGQIARQAVDPEGWMHPSLEFIEMFEDNDARFDANVTFWDNPGNSDYSEVTFFGDSLAMINKHIWVDEINSNGQQSGNDILFRYADALLSLAEAYWREDPAANQGAILNLLDRIRTRADLPPVDLSNVPMTPLLEGTHLENDNLGRAIFQERTIELFAEGHRMFDLIRFDVAFDVLTAQADSRKTRESRIQGTYNIQPHEIMLPIPTQEINNTEGLLEQNDGW
ncbi:MAG: RagB/SusD family nutrient uptake outer membrane protein [Balneolaceae bacterium]|nr:RagB/SusD family nutrient uptake outer membrane protein [Balneolaceae bacterium]